MGSPMRARRPTTISRKGYEKGALGAPLVFGLFEAYRQWGYGASSCPYPLSAWRRSAVLRFAYLVA